MWHRIFSVMILLVGFAGAQALPQRAAIVGGGNSNAGQCTIVVTVDGNVQVDVLGADGMLGNLGGGAPSWRRFECTLAMPASPANFQFTAVSGRGHQSLTLEPRNGGPAVVRIEDTEGGVGEYTFRLSWSNGPAGQDRGLVGTRDDRGSQSDRGSQRDRGSQVNQTRISLRNNKYSPADDVKLGRQAAAEVEQKMPILRDAEATSYVESVGRRLVASIQPEFQHPEFQYYFKIVDASDINAFALPGGPMYVNRGMITAARTEGEMAGVMAHEISHVALRHGTAQATKAQKYQYAGIAGAIAGAVIGGNIGNVVGQGSQAAIGTYLLKFSREYETEADVFGVQTMAKDGYDPLDLANMFRTIAQQRGGSSPAEFLSSHPDPGNREARIKQEAQYLRVTNPVRDTQEFSRMQARLRGGPPARSMEEIARSDQRSPQDRRAGQFPQNSTVGGTVGSPSSRLRTYTEGNLFRVSVPDNWRELPGANSVTFAPEAAYGKVQGNDIFTHGVEIGVFRHETHPLQEATDELIASLGQGNPNMQRQSGSQRGQIAGREALVTTLNNSSQINGGVEVVAIYTTQLRDGGLFYVIALAPQNEFRNYQGTFQRIVRSVQITE